MNACNRLIHAYIKKMSQDFLTLITLSIFSNVSTFTSALKTVKGNIYMKKKHVILGTLLLWVI